MINDSHKPNIIVKMEFRWLKLQLVMLGFGAPYFINNLLFQIIKIITITTYIMLFPFIGLIIYTFLMIPLQAALTLNHVPRPMVETVTIH